MDAKVDKKSLEAVETLKAEIRAMPEPLRAEVLDDALGDITVLPFLCPLIFGQTSTEDDYDTIIGRVRITATVNSQGSVINQGETFTVNVSVQNCSGYEIEGAILSAGSTLFASVTSQASLDLGTMQRGARLTRTFDCVANAVTPTQNGPADTIINIGFGGHPLIRGSKRQPVQTEVVPG